MEICTVPYCNGEENEVKYGVTITEKERLWDRYYMDAPKRQRQFVEQYKIVKRV
jgi:hypothetical protein